ncbi:hypothetical protein FHW16_002746 [Phyllobacterium myrsinacearum]|uniref:Uncharacterized protein n=1 Tax=Phyllobacterium myrsinacearum TaxID=28101 RepID=A0A839EL67_9HYPH|nr:hypothetical protein [Phyllobacterium myrsinacearum]
MSGLKVVFDVGQQAGPVFWALSMMGIIFSGLVLVLFILVALTLDWVAYLWRGGEIAGLVQRPSTFIRTRNTGAVISQSNLISMQEHRFET